MYKQAAIRACVVTPPTTNQNDDASLSKRGARRGGKSESARIRMDTWHLAGPGVDNSAKTSQKKHKKPTKSFSMALLLGPAAARWPGRSRPPSQGKRVRRPRNKPPAVRGRQQNKKRTAPQNAKWQTRPHRPLRRAPPNQPTHLIFCIVLLKQRKQWQQRGGQRGVPDSRIQQNRMRSPCGTPRTLERGAHAYP